MSTSMTISVPLIPKGEGDSNGTKGVVLYVKFKGEQALPLIFINADVISWFVYEHTYVELLVIEKPELRTTVFCFPGGQQCRGYMCYHDKGRILATSLCKFSASACYTGATGTHRLAALLWPCWYNMSDIFRPKDSKPPIKASKERWIMP